MIRISNLGESDSLVEVQGRWRSNPLVPAIVQVLVQLSRFKELVRAFYLEVILSFYRCPDCNGRLKMVGVSECSAPVERFLTQRLAFNKAPAVVRPWSVRPSIIPVPVAIGPFLRSFFLMKDSSTKLILGR